MSSSRLTRTAAALALSACLAAACSSSGGEDQTDDLFLDKVEAACHDASAKIDKLQSGDDNAVTDLDDYLNEALDALKALDVPQTLARDYGEFTSTIDDETTETGKLVRATRDGDADATATSAEALNQLRFEADGQARGLGVLKCVGLTPENGLAAVAVSTTGTDTTDTTATTDTATTDTVTTDTVTTDTAAASEIFPDDLSIASSPPDGYKWVPLDPVDASGLYENDVVGSLVTYYAGGRVENLADGSTASIYVVQISEPWTDETKAAYEYWEGVNGGTATTTPTGIPVTQKLGAFEDTDCVVFTGDTSGITVCTFTGIDGLSILDGFVNSPPLES